jgi:D-threonate/D-erythronate kinase
MSAPSSNRGIECLLIADDLTGACDAAVHFARRGRRTRVWLDSLCEDPGVEVMAVSTDSRDLEAPAAKALMLTTASRLSRVAPAILFKKIDSTLRGNIGPEIAAIMDALGIEVAIMCPAFPALSRIVSDGYLRVQDGTDFHSVQILTILQAAGLKSCLHVRPGGISNAIATGARVISLDSESDLDLDNIVREGLALERRLLWVGSGGLASALARTFPALRTACDPGQARPGPTLFAIGSDHPVTTEQVRALRAQRRAPVFDSEETAPESIGAALLQREHVCLLITPETSFERVRELIADLPPVSLLLSGGRTASLVCQAMQVQRIDLCDEIVAGIPRGVLRGGKFAGTPVATKSGGFGNADALIQVADFFSCQTN